MTPNTRRPAGGRCANGACVRVAFTADGAVNVADEHGGVIELRPDVWTELLSAIRGGDDYPGPSIGGYPGPWINDRTGGVEWIGVPPGSGVDHVVLRYTTDEWVAFLAAVRDGKFSIDDLTT